MHEIFSAPIQPTVRARISRGEIIYSGDLGSFALLVRRLSLETMIAKTFPEFRAWEMSEIAEARANVRQESTRADSRIRTDDLIITNDLLYQLSYIGIPVLSSPPRSPEVTAGPESVIRPLSGRRRKAG